MASNDEELRRELEKYGVTVGPITASTRGIYAKRLEKFAKAHKIASTPAGKSLSNKSSRRQALARNRSESPASRSGRSTRVLRRKVVGFSTDEDDEESDAATKKPFFRKSNPPAGVRSTRQNSRSGHSATSQVPEVPRSLTPVHRRVKALANMRKSSSVSPKRDATSSPLSRPGERYSDDSDDASERSSATNDSWVEMESVETNTSPSLARNRTRDSEERLVRFRAEIEAWRQSEEKENTSGGSLPLHLSSGRRSAVLRSLDQNVRGNPASRNGGPNAASKIVSRASSRTDDVQSSVTDRANGEMGQKRPWTLNFSSFLPIGTCIFFVILGLLYVTMKYDPSLNSGRMILDGSAKSSEEESLRVASSIYDHVAVYSGEKECGTIASDSHLLVTGLRKDLGMMDDSGRGAFSKACEKLIANDWDVQFYDRQEVLITDPKRQHEAVYVDTTAPVLSGWCRFTRAVQKVLLRIIFTTAVGVLVWLGLVYRHYRSERQREEREQMYTMVQKILDVLRRQYDLSQNDGSAQPFLPILHVRDMIIPPQDRGKMERVWERAKQFLSASETRIRVENQRIQGEDYLVWRWIQASSPAKRHTPTSRVWQGEAFDITRGPMICPTPCLKLRNVFDAAMEIGKNWIEQIQDSILEKCQGNNEILRICVEKDSKEGLVYMLCASNQAAGRAFQALHGAWFDGRLVTVKFIRLHRFHQRFPDSVNQSRTAMRPTSAVPVSTIVAPSPPIAGDNQHYEKLYPTLPDD